MGRLLVVILVCGAAPWVARPAAAAPVVTVKGRTAVQIVGIYPGDDGAVLVGRLLDKDLDVGIPERTVEISLRLRGARRTFRARTDAEGEFRIVLPPGRQAYEVEARFTGDGSYAPDAPPSQSMDITKLTPEIGLEMDRELDLTAPRHELRIVTRAEGRNVSIPLELGVEGGPGLGVQTTDANGRRTVSLPAERLGGPGPVTIVARFAGDAELNPARARREALVVSAVTVTLSAERSAVEPEEELALTGRVTDARGPVTGATVGLEAMGRHVASVLTEERGSFRFELRARDFPPGPLDLVARFTPTAIWRRPAVSPGVQVTVLPPTPIPARLYLIPVAVTALIMLALLMVRFWPALRSEETDEDAGASVQVEADPEPVESGVRLARTSLRSIVKPAFDLHGTVWNPVDRCAVQGARIVVDDGQGRSVLELFSDAAGRFAIPGLPAGAHRIVVSRPGFVSEAFQVTIPHRGNLHGVRVDLVEVRVRLLEIYREAARPLLPGVQLWARWTPRELARHVGSRAGRRNPELEGLTRVLEQAYWSAAPAEEVLLERARELARTLRSA